MALTVGLEATFSNVTCSNQFKGAINDTASTPSFSWLTDENTGMYHLSNDVIGLTAGGISMMVIGASNVGINTTTPASAFHVAGTTALLNQVPTSGLVSYFPFEDSIADVIGSNTLTGSPAGYIVGKVGKAVRFTHNAGGAGSQRVTKSSANITLPLTLAAWVYPEVLSQVAQNIVIIDGSTVVIAIAIKSSNKLYVNHTNAVSRDFDVVVNTWYHVVYTVDSLNNTFVYLNGQLVDQRSTASALPATNNLGVGATPAGSSAFQGAVDDVRIYNRVLDANEVNTLYQNQVGGAAVYTNSRLGIGTVAPRQALDVVGNASFTGTISANNMGLYRNRIINGNMQVFQRKLDPVTVANSGTTRNIDMFNVTASITTGTLTISRPSLTSSDPPFALGHMYSMKMSVFAAATNYTSIDISQTVEGTNIADFGWGATWGTPITVSLWVRIKSANKVLSCAVRNDTSSHSYVWDFTLNRNDVWQYITHTIPAPPAGTTWATNTNAGLILSIGSLDTSNRAPTTQTWYAGNYVASVASSNIYNTTDNYIEFTGVQLEKGTQATPFEFRPYTIEHRLCQRYLVYRTYLENDSNWFNLGIGAANTSTTLLLPYLLPVSMRIVPSVSSSSSTWVAIGGAVSLTITAQTNASSVNMVTLLCTSATGSFGLNNAYLVYRNSTASAWLQISAEF